MSMNSKFEDFAPSMITRALQDANKALDSLITKFDKLGTKAKSAGATIKTAVTIAAGGDVNTAAKFGISKMAESSLGKFSTPLPGKTQNYANNLLTAAKTSMSYNAGSSGSGGSGSGSMGNVAAANTSGDAGTASTAKLFGLSDVFNMLSGVGSGMATTLPSVGNTLNRARGYYNATMFGANQMARASTGMQAAFGVNSVEDVTFNTLKGGLTGVGSDAAVAEYLSSRGMTISGTSNSTYQQTLRTISNAAQYMNIDNMAAAQSVEGLTSGKGASAMLRNYGIFTADPNTGKEKTQGQIFEELAQRMTMGRQSASVEQTQASIRRGALGANIDAFFQGDQAGAAMFRQYMLQRAASGGTNNMDLSNQANMDKIYAANGLTAVGGAMSAVGNINPLNATYTLNGSDTAQLDKAEQSYIAGMQAAVGPLTALNEAAGTLAATFAGLPNAMMQTLMGSNTVKGALKTGSSVLGYMNSYYSTVADNPVYGALVNPLYQGGYEALGAIAGAGALATGGQELGNLLGNQGSNMAAGQRSQGGQGGSSSRGILGKVYQGGVGGAWELPSSSRVTQTYGHADAKLYGINKATGQANVHDGIDYGANIGDPIRAVADGVVDSYRSDHPQQDQQASGSYGNFVKLRHANGYATLYAHLSSVASNIKNGATISKGDIIGYAGNSGYTRPIGPGGAHLHFEMWKGNGKIDPNSVTIEALSGTASTTTSSGASSDYSGATTGSSTSLSGASLSDYGAQGQQAFSLISALTSGNADAMTSAIGSLSSNMQSQVASALAKSGSSSSYTATPTTRGKVDLTNAAYLTATSDMMQENGTAGTTASNNTNNVVINVQVADTSTGSAVTFAQMVSQYLQNKTLQSNVGGS